MKTRVVLFATVLSTMMSCQVYAQTFDSTAQLNDLSDKNSPLRATGQASFHTVLSTNRERAECSLAGSVTNVSSRTIVAFEATLDLSSEFSGCQHSDFTMDYFFDTNLMPPGTHRDLTLGGPPEESEYSGTSVRREPRAQFRVEFVQFADGSSFGKSPWSENLESERRAQVELIKSLLHAFGNGDASALTAEVKRRLAGNETPRYLFTLLLQTNETIERRGADAAVDDLHKWFANAEKRANTFNLSGRLIS